MTPNNQYANKFVMPPNLPLGPETYAADHDPNAIPGIAMSGHQNYKKNYWDVF